MKLILEIKKNLIKNEKLFYLFLIRENSKNEKKIPKYKSYHLRA
jgi:hypothetical protein